MAFETPISLANESALAAACAFTSSTWYAWGRYKWQSKFKFNWYMRMLFWLICVCIYIYVCMCVGGGGVWGVNRVARLRYKIFLYLSHFDRKFLLSSLLLSSSSSFYFILFFCLVSVGDRTRATSYKGTQVPLGYEAIANFYSFLNHPIIYYFNFTNQIRYYYFMH